MRPAIIALGRVLVLARCWLHDSIAVVHLLFRVNTPITANGVSSWRFESLLGHDTFHRSSLENGLFQSF